MSGIEDKVVVITGASSGIGEATALLLAERGARSRPTDLLILAESSEARLHCGRGPSLNTWQREAIPLDRWLCRRP